MKNNILPILYLTSFLAGCAPIDTHYISTDILQRGYDCTRDLSDHDPQEICLSFSDDLDLRVEDTLIVQFRRKADTSSLLREGLIVDRGIDSKLEECDPKDECRQILRYVYKNIP
jgi:hypothetical protein